jgi:hypothetical protein
MCLPFASLGRAETNSNDTAGQHIAIYRSRHFTLHTDVPPDRARTLLDRLESILRMIARYWGRPLRDSIECYVVDDLANWKRGALPHPLARVLIERVGGGIDQHPIRSGDTTVLKARVYATSIPGVAEHEVVHAYCQQTFGTCGPDWYQEGMAQLVCHSREKARGVRCDPAMIHFLRNSPPQSLDSIVRGHAFTSPLTDTFTRLGRKDSKNNQRGLISEGTVWLASDDETLREAREAYWWSWALCHMLHANPNYRERFRALGRAMLNGQDASFAAAFGPVYDELAFEYRFFLEHFDQGFRADLCHWNWTKSFTSKVDAWQTIVVGAARGYQASGLTVLAGRKYQYQSTGRWIAHSEGNEVTADGGRLGHGRLVGVVMQNFSLSESIELGADGTFVAPCTGRLHLRCRDAWNRVADNQGAIHVRLKQAEPKDSGPSPH